MIRGDAAGRFRAASAVQLCRLLGGDESLIEEIRQRNANIDPALQDFFLAKVGDRVKWEEKRALAKIICKEEMAMIGETQPLARPDVYRKANGQLNFAATNFHKKEQGEILGITLPMKKWVARDYFLTGQLELVNRGGEAGTCIRARRLPPAQEELRIDGVLAAMSLLRDEGNLSRRLLEASPDPNAKRIKGKRRLEAAERVKGKRRKVNR